MQTTETPGIARLYIYLKRKLTGIDPVKKLEEASLLFISLADSIEEVTQYSKSDPALWLFSKAIQKKNLLIMLQIAHYRHGTMR